VLRSIISLFLPEYFLVAISMGLILTMGKGGLVSGPIINEFLTSWAKSLAIMSGSAVADCRFLHVKEDCGTADTPGWKP